MSTVADAFAAALCAAGVQRVYGLPGEDHLRLLDALGDANLTYVAAREETAAVLMAATEAQATGRPGVALVTLAPGITNAMNGLAHAWLDRVPLLVVTGQHGPERAPVIIRQGMDTHRLVDSVTKWNATASARIHQVLARALDTALAPPAGPVLLELREDVSAATPLDSLSAWPLLQAPTRTHALIGRAAIDLEIPTDAARLIEAARRPVIVVGGNCPTDAQTRQALEGACQRLRAPLFASPAAMGVLPPQSEWCAGTFMNGNLEADVLGASDVIITVGLDATDFFNAAWRYEAPIVALNEQADIQRFAPTTVQLVGASCLTLGALASLGSASTSTSTSASTSASVWTVADVGRYKATFSRPFHLEDRLEDGAFTIPSALRLARALLPPETRIAVDAGFGKPLTSYLWSSTEPNHYFTAHGLSTMGYALPAANALCLTYPDEPVVAFMGDGSLLMRASEISVAAEHELAPIYVTWMDGALAQIETKQLRQRLRPVGARLPRLSSAKVAEAFGGYGVDVDTLEDFAQALSNAQHARCPTLIGARVDQTYRAEWYELLRG